MDREHTPWKAGFRRDDLADPRGVFPKLELPLGNTKSLSAMESDFVFFTPAIVYLYIGIGDAPLFDFVQWRRSWLSLYYRKFSVPLFAGLNTLDGDRDWNYALWAVRREDWQPLADFLVSLAFYAPLTKEVMAVGITEFKIPDPLALMRMDIVSSVPVVNVAAIGMNGSRSCLALKRRGDFIFDPPRLTRFDPEISMQVFEAAITSGSNPMLARDMLKELEKRGRQSST